MEILEFKYVTTDDISDNDIFNDGHAWSRCYEYPIVIDYMKNLLTEESSVHNSSWGFAGIHVIFKEELDIRATQAGEDIPIEVSQIVAGYVVSVVVELEARTTSAGKVLAPAAVSKPPGSVQPQLPDASTRIPYSDEIVGGKLDVADVIQPTYDAINEEYGLDETQD